MTLTPAGYRPRVIDERFDRMLKTFGAVYVEGPKYCGKTWACRNQSNSEIQLDDETTVTVMADRSYALRGERPRLIDEWQRVPGLWDDVRFEVDRSIESGHFILCGSYSLSRSDLSKRFHSGIGRIATLRMHTMTLFESGDSDGAVSLRSLFDGSFESVECKRHTIEEIVHMTARGGWPRNVYSSLDYETANLDYIDALCRSDVVSIDGVQRSERKMRMLVKSLARNESTVVKDSTLMKDMLEYDDESISESTFYDYKEILGRLKIVWEQPAFSPRIRSSVRVGKGPKRHLADPSLSMAALGLTEEMAVKDLETYGFMFEAMCERDLLVYAEEMHATLFHYRDHSGHEIDAVIEMPDGSWGAFEIKLGFHQIDAAAENLLSVCSMIDEKGGRPPSVMCVIYGIGKAAYRRPDGIYVVPITSLRP